MYKKIDDRFVRKVINREVTRNIVRVDFLLDWVSFERKVNFACEKLKEISHTKARLLVLFWEKKETMQALLEGTDCSSWRILDEYKVGRRRPGQLEIYFDESMDDKFIHKLIKKHYGYELAKTDVLSLDLIFTFDTADDIIIAHLYDDRGFRFFYINK